jgi:indole-3-glycerol phosphate synthase
MARLHTPLTTAAPSSAPSILTGIVDYHRRHLPLVQRRASLKALEARIEAAPPPKDFAAALRRDGIGIIAEVKKASPSAGLLKARLSPRRLARRYAAAGAAAISVLTEPRFFRGSLSDLQAVRSAFGEDGAAGGSSGPPLLRKDFLFDPYQVYQARAFGADALLLIVAVLDDPTLRYLLSLTHDLGMEALVEVHDAEETERALEAGARVIGINNRDLRDFTVDLETTARLQALIPRDRVVVSESGIKNATDMRRLQEWGVNAALIGEALVTAASVENAFQSLLLGRYEP